MKINISINIVTIRCQTDSMKLFSWNQLLPLKLISVHLYNVLPIFVNEMRVSTFQSHLKNFIATKEMY